MKHQLFASTVLDVFEHFLQSKVGADQGVYSLSGEMWLTDMDNA